MRVSARGAAVLAPFALLCFALSPTTRAQKPVGKPSGTKPAARGLVFAGAENGFVLDGPFDSARILLDETAGQARRDTVTRAKFSVADPKIATVQDGFLRPVGDGATRLLARVGGETTAVSVTVRGLKTARVPEFTTQVLPVLTRAGCNQGGCHGAQAGKGGFKLSLQGFDPDADYEAITRASGARRVTPARPEDSLLLRKPTGATPHKGGKLFSNGSPEHKLLTAWIGGKMPGPRAGDPSVVSLQITPTVRSAKVGDTQNYRVVATLSDKTRRDVTADTLFSASDGAVASVSQDGVARVVGRGEASVLIRYRDVVAVASLLSPFGPPKSAPPAPDVRAPFSDRIDFAVDSKLAALGLDISPGCSDTDFLRRVSLDLIGVAPTPGEIRAFVADTRPDRRERLVDSLLARPEFVDRWTLFWGDILRSGKNALGDRGLLTLNRWLRESVATNKRFDTMARELVTARGSLFDDGPANFFRAASNPQAQAEMTSQVFLGVRMQCAQCHNHPYEKWRQSQYFELAAYFARVKTKPGDAPDERIVFAGNDGEIGYPKTGKIARPTPLDGPALPKNFTGDRREALADWLTSPKNPFFAKITVNRLWRHFLGAGVIEPVDDIRVTNPPSNAALLQTLATQFIKDGYDLKKLMRAIVLSKTYQRSASPTKTNAADTRYLSHFPFKRLSAEILLDAIVSATGSDEKFSGYPAGLRAAQLPDTTAPSYFLDLFGRPARNVVCQCERADDPGLGQILHLMNGPTVSEKVAGKDGRLARLLAANATDAAITEEIYLAALGRFPSDDERFTVAWEVTHAKDRRAAFEDILWALLNSKEFLFVR